jgi:5-deoxy-glucuronate isomerase
VLLFKSPRESGRLVRIFAYRDFSLYVFRGGRGDNFKLRGGEEERLLFSLTGEVDLDGEQLGTRDMAYIPPGEGANVSLRAPADVYIASASSSSAARRFVKRFRGASVVESGLDNYRRTITVMIDIDDRAERFLAGYTEGEPGAWTSYPPHRHDNKPEAYIFYGMGKGFGVQLILDEAREAAYIVRDHDVVLIDRGYHPNVGTTLAGIKYAWIIAAPPGERDLSVNIHPEFASVPLPTTHLKIDSSRRG